MTSGEEGGGGAFGGAKILQKIMTPIKINKYYGVGGMCRRGAKIVQKIMVPSSLSVIMINKYCGVGEGGGGGIEGALKLYKR